MLEHTKFYHNMQYQVNPKDLSPRNGQIPPFWHFGSFKNAFLRHLNDLSWSGNAVEWWKTFSTITLCNIKSIQQTELQKMTTNLFFGSLDHSKMDFIDFWMILHDLVMLSNAGKHLVLVNYTSSSRSDRPKSRKWPKTTFRLFESFKNSFLWHLNDPSWPGNVARC